MEGRFIPTCVGRLELHISLVVACAVHPHLCGAVIFSDSGSPLGTGSSPPVWGGYQRVREDYKANRFIPTCVGRLPRMHVSPITVTVHPHLCGAVSLNDCMEDLGFGSSPPVWGGSHHPCRLARPQRFIPTCVGRLHALFFLCHVHSVHPHLCGAVKSCCGVTDKRYGSSPPVWGG